MKTTSLPYLDDVSPLVGAVIKPTVEIQPRKGLFHLDLKAIWQYRELLYFLIWRDIKVRYKQTVIGAGWAILQPLMTMAIFTVIFAHFAKIPWMACPILSLHSGPCCPGTIFRKLSGRVGSASWGMPT